MNDTETEKGDHEGPDTDDQYAEHVSHVAFTGGTYELSRNDAIDSSKTNVDDDVEQAAKFSTPDAKGEAGNCNLSES